MRPQLMFGSLARRVGVLIVLALLVNWAIVGIAIQAFNVPGSNDLLDFPILLPATIFPVIGNSIGFFAAYRKPNKGSLAAFLVPAVLITAGLGFLGFKDYADHDDVGILVTSLLLTLGPTLVVVFGLLGGKDKLFGEAHVPVPEVPAYPAVAPAPALFYEPAPDPRPPAPARGTGTGYIDPRLLPPREPPQGPAAAPAESPRPKETFDRDRWRSQ